MSGRGAPDRSYQRGRGRGFNAYDRSDKSFASRWSNRKINPPPKTPCSDPLEMPFPKLRARNANGTMTLDEELLRALIGQFTVASVASLPFPEVFEKLKRDNPHLTYLLYDDPDYVWSYIRCYPEHFAIDRDPRYPNNVWYLSKCKLVAKSDRRRYQREVDSGNIAAVVNSGNDAEWDELRYDDRLEYLSLTFISAIFVQIETKLQHENWSSRYLPIKFIQSSLDKGPTPNAVRDYVGTHVNEFFYRRMHFFNIFGSQGSLRSADYVETVRNLTKCLQQNDGTYGLRNFYEHFLSSPQLGRYAVRAISVDPAKFDFDEFLLFLNCHKFLFRLRPRDQLVELRHGVVPTMVLNDIKCIPTYESVKCISSTKDLDDLEQAEVLESMFELARNDEEYGGGFNSAQSEYLPKPSFYTMRWLSENFDSVCRIKDDLTENSAEDNGLFEWRASKSSAAYFGKADTKKLNNAEDKPDGWPSLTSTDHETCTSSAPSWPDAKESGKLKF